jgi:protease-4
MYVKVIGLELVVLAALGLTTMGSIRDARADDATKKAAPAAKPASSTEKKADSKPVSPVKPKVVVFRLTSDIKESPAEESFSLNTTPATTLESLLTRIKKAAGDSDVKAVVLMHEGGTVGAAQAEELRAAMAMLRAAGKPVYANADGLSMREYLLLAGASRLSVVPTADLWITGMFGEAPYLRGLLDKMGVKPDFLTCGAYKSAAEMFVRSGPSPEADAMQNWLLDSLYESSLALIAKGRNVDVAQVKKWVDGGPYTSEKACAAGLIDAVEQRQDFQAMLEEKFGKDVVFDRKYGQKQQPKMDFSSPFAMLKIWGELLGQTQKPSTKKDAIGIVYVEGPIVMGGGQPSPFSMASASSSKIRKALDEAARDDSIKAVVLRVDSPGGSAVASEIILDATKRVKAKKPFVVSMGNVAGSGGYYVACASDLIFADSMTITASIGVVSGKLATSDLWKKVGVTFKSYKRGENSGMLASGDVFAPAERQRMQSWMDEIYGVFKGHVRASRGDRLKKPLDELAGGRVFTGKQALELGLIDKIGGLQDAIAHVASAAKLTDYDVRVVPAAKSFLEQLLEDASGEDTERGIGTRLAGQLSGGPGVVSLVDLAMPHLRGLDAGRVRAVTAALGRLQLIQQEGVILMMPEFVTPR